MARLVIRPVVRNDAQRLAHVHVEAWRTAYRSILPGEFLDKLSKQDRQEKWETILSKDAPHEFNIAAEVDGQIVGFAGGGPERNNDPRFVGELYALYLLTQYRRQGIGTALLNESMNLLTNRDMHSMKVWVLKENPFRNFYKKRGGTLLTDELKVTIGDLALTEIAYGWSEFELKNRQANLPTRPNSQ